FDDTRRSGAGVPIKLSLSPRAPLRAGSPLRLLATVDDGELKPVVRIGLKLGADERFADRDPQPAHFELPAPEHPGAAHADLLAFDRFGGLLAAAPTGFTIDPKPGRPLPLQWPLWGAVALAFAGASGYFGLQSNQLGAQARNDAYGSDAFAHLTAA